jgi:Cu/Zn superoxide dismutase
MDGIVIFNAKLSPIYGYIRFHQCDKHVNTVVEFNLSGFSKNSKHAIHIHTKGITSLNKPCESTCDHYNPHGNLHGSRELHGKNRHAGDLINNLHSDKNGNFKFVYEDDLINVNDILGRSVVIHSGVDDLGIYRETDKGSATTGNAGGRISCAVIGRY